MTHGSVGLIALTLLVGTATPLSVADAQVTAAFPAPASPVVGDTIRLTDEERQAIIDQNTLDSAAAVRGESVGSKRAPLEVHGELGAVVGSNGTRAVYGTAAIPLGDHGGAVVSFESSRFGYRR